MPEEKDQPAEKRIIIDEDYKAQVQADKETAAKAAEPKPAPRQRPPLPPASFSILVASLATQALLALGLFPNPVTERTEQDLEQAKHLIDTLGVLEEKTKGNLAPDEKQQLETVLFDLRMQYVEVAAKSQKGAGPASHTRS